MKEFFQVIAFIVGAILAVNLLPGLIAALAGVAPGALLGVGVGAVLYSVGYARGHNAHVRAVEKAAIEGARKKAASELL